MSNEQLATMTSFSLVPQTLSEAMELAKIIADSDLAPKDYRSKPGNVLIAVQMGQEVGLSPMAAIQNIAVINGKPNIYGDAGKAILLSNGLIIEEDDISVIKQTGMGRCKITRKGRPPCERTFSVEDAKTAGLWAKQGPWTQYPERQLAWRAFWFAARDIASDLLKGLSGFEETLDYSEKDVTPTDSPVSSTQGQKGKVIDAAEEEHRTGLITALEAFAKRGEEAFIAEWKKLGKANKKDIYLVGEAEYLRLLQVAQDNNPAREPEQPVSDANADFVKDLEAAEGKPE